MNANVIKLTIFIADGHGTPSSLYTRKKEVEMNPDMLDKYDSFYDTTKSLLVLFQIMGIMPIMRSPKGKIHQLLYWIHKIMTIFQDQCKSERHFHGSPRLFYGHT